MSMRRLIEGLQEAEGAKGDYAAVLNGDGPSALRDKMVKALMPEIFAKAWGAYSPSDIKGEDQVVAKRWFDDVSSGLSVVIREAAPYDSKDDFRFALELFDKANGDYDKAKALLQASGRDAKRIASELSDESVYGHAAAVIALTKKPNSRTKAAFKTVYELSKIDGKMPAVKKNYDALVQAIRDLEA